MCGEGSAVVTKMRNIVVLGGGPCGLSAAWELSENGYDVTVLEKDSGVGGLCITHEYQGYRFDLGGHRFVSPNKGFVDRVCRMMGDELLTAERKSVILLNGKTFQYPLSARDLFAKIGFRTGIMAFFSFMKEAVIAVFLRKKEVSFYDWVTHRFGRILYDLFFGPYTEKVWGISPKLISSDWASQRIALLNLSDVCLRLSGLKEDTPRTYARTYFYPRKGIGQIFEVMAKVVRQNGGRIVTHADVSGVEVCGGTVKKIRYMHHGFLREIDCDGVISTMPLPDLIHALPEHLVRDILPDARGLRYRAIRFMNMLVDRPDISDNTWMYVVEKKYVMTRIQEPRRRSPFNAPDGKTSLMLEMPCDVNDDLWNYGDEELLARCLTDLCELGINVRDDVTGYFTSRVTHGYPVYSLDYRSHQGRLLNFLDQFDNLITCGRQGAFRYIFMDTAMEMGIAAARHIVSERHYEKGQIQDMRSGAGLLEKDFISVSR
ncbi:MAG: amine oxidase [Candidatus Brocadia sp.]|nr:FAD-dependent oxidoreductase [Candidatus Brocadia sp. AMX3]MDG5997267.1 FAD-dependent oxidoreductase [Candidatus Brocadia sp.]RIK02306.1 MAG: amine oxidase [Candidatus Brocadia sp.]